MKNQSKIAALLAAGFILGTAGTSFAQSGPPPAATGNGAPTGTTPGTGADSGAVKTTQPATPSGPVTGTNATQVGTGDSQTKTGTDDRPSTDTGTSQGSASSTPASSSSGKKKHGRHGKKSQPSSTTNSNGSAATTTQ